MSAFIDGFSSETGMSENDEVDNWAAYSSQLSDIERDIVESGGYLSGIREGERFNEWMEQIP